MLVIEEDFLPNTGRAFPDAIDGTPQNYNEREAMENRSDIPTLVPGDEINQLMIEACQTVIDLKQSRKEINAEIQSEIERLESKGIPRKAFKATLMIMELTEDQRQAYDRGIMVARQAVGIPIQADLFE